MKNNTAEGLRNRLFEALDRVINKEITTKEVEGICFVSEQIIKTARVELEIYQETNKNEENKRQHELKLVRENQDSISLLTNVIDIVEEDKDV